MSEGNAIEFKPDPDDRGRDILADKRSNPRDPVNSPESVEAVRTVTNRTTPDNENPITPSSSQASTTPDTESSTTLFNTQKPALPVLSFFGAAESVTPDVIRGMIMDTVKNITVNGRSPNINGSTIEFNVESKLSAPEQWSQVNGLNYTVLSPPLTPLPPTLPDNYLTGTNNINANQLVPTPTSTHTPTPAPTPEHTPALNQPFVTQKQKIENIKADSLSMESTKVLDFSKAEEPKVEVTRVETPKLFASSKAEEPKVEAPKVEAPKVEAPKLFASSKAEEPKVEAPKVEAPKLFASSKAEEPKVEAPKVETPKADEPKVEAPKVEAPKLFASSKAEQPKVEAPKVEAPKLFASSKAEVSEPDVSMFSMAKPKSLKERARELEEDKGADSEVFSMAKPKSLKVDSGRNTIDDIIDRAESESKNENSGSGARRRGKDKIFDRIEQAIENEDFDKARKLNERVKNRELETELRGEGKDRDRRSTKDIAESEGIDTKGKSSKELREEILQKRREEQEEKEAKGKGIADLDVVGSGKETAQLIPVPFTKADRSENLVLYMMGKSQQPCDNETVVLEDIKGTDGGADFNLNEYWFPSVFPQPIPEEGTHALAIEDGKLKWIPIVDCNV